MNYRLWALALCVAGISLAAKADTLQLVTSQGDLNGNASVNFGQLGSDGANLTSSFHLTSSNGIGVTGSLNGGGSATLCDQSFNNCNDALPSTYSIQTSNTPLTFTFGSGVSGFGTTFEAQDYSNATGSNLTATASLALYNGATLLGTVSTGLNDLGTQNYIGVLDTTGANITSAVLSIGSETLTTLTVVPGQFNDYVLSYDGNAGHVDVPFCTSLPVASLSLVANQVRCPQKYYQNFYAGQGGFQIYISYGQCQSIGTPCTNFPGTVFGGDPKTTASNSSPTPNQYFQADSLDLLTPNSVSTVPEPGSLLLLASGLAGVAVRRIRRMPRS